jgi:hypothetical protein
VLADGVVVGRIMKAAGVPVGQSWMWTLAFEHHEDRAPHHVSRRKRRKSSLVYARVGRCQGRSAWRGACAAVPPVTCYIR